MALTSRLGDLQIYNIDSFTSIVNSGVEDNYYKYQNYFALRNFGNCAVMFKPFLSLGTPLPFPNGLLLRTPKWPPSIVGGIGADFPEGLFELRSEGWRDIRLLGG